MFMKLKSTTKASTVLFVICKIQLRAFKQIDRLMDRPKKQQVSNLFIWGHTHTRTHTQYYWPLVNGNDQFVVSYISVQWYRSGGTHLKTAKSMHQNVLCSFSRIFPWKQQNVPLAQIPKLKKKIFTIFNSWWLLQSQARLHIHGICLGSAVGYSAQNIFMQKSLKLTTGSAIFKVGQLHYMYLAWKGLNILIQVVTCKLFCADWNLLMHLDCCAVQLEKVLPYGQRSQYTGNHIYHPYHLLFLGEILVYDLPIYSQRNQIYTPKSQW